MFDFNPIRPPFYGDVNNDYLNEADKYVDELLLQEYFSNHKEEEDEDASTR